MLRFQIVLPILLAITIFNGYGKSGLSTTSWEQGLAIYNFNIRINHIIHKYFLQKLYFLVIDHEGDSSSKVTDDVLRNVHNSKVTQVVSLHNHSRADKFNKLIRRDNVENSVGFIIIRNTVGRKCFADIQWKRSAFWNPQALFILVVTTNFTEGTAGISEILKDCWDRFNILNMEVIFWHNFFKGKINNADSKNSWLEINSLSYNPFNKETYQVNLLDKSKISNANKLFQNKLRDTKGFIIEAPIGTSHVLLFDYEDTSNESIPLGGPNGKIFNAILEKMNLIANISHYETYDEIVSSEERTLSRGLYPQSGMGLYYIIQRSTYPHDQDCITFIVPKSLEVPKYMNLILPFSTLIWLLFVCSNISMAVVWKTLIIFDVFENNIRLQNNVFLDSLRMSMGGSTQSPPSLFHQRFVIMMFLIFNLIINNTYTGKLYGYLTVPTYLPDMKTLEEVADSDLRISVMMIGFTGVSEVADTFDLTDKILHKLIMKILYINDDDEALDMIAFSRNISRGTLKYEGRTLIDKPKYFHNGRSLLHVVEECYCSILNVFGTVERHSPFLTKFNDIIVRLNEAGFVQQWKKDLLYRGLLLSNKNSHGSEPLVLTLDHLQGVFLLLCLGLSMASIIFFVEMVIHCFGIVSKSI